MSPLQNCCCTCGTAHRLTTDDRSAHTCILLYELHVRPPEWLTSLAWELTRRCYTSTNCHSTRRDDACMLAGHAVALRAAGCPYELSSLGNLLYCMVDRDITMTTIVLSSLGDHANAAKINSSSRKLINIDTELTLFCWFNVRRPTLLM